MTTMKAMNPQDDIPSISIHDFKDHYVLAFDLTSMQDATENCHYTEINVAIAWDVSDVWDREK